MPNIRSLQGIISDLLPVVYPSRGLLWIVLIASMLLVGLSAAKLAGYEFGAKKLSRALRKYFSRE
jgi:hypothetical protein